MNPKMFAELFEAMNKFVEQNCESPEWEKTNFLSHENLELHMAKAAEIVFDATVESSVFTRDQSG